jgi:ABC-2 type transport system permease protein
VLRPATILPSIFISSFLFLAFGYAFGTITRVPGFPAEDYLAFLTPFILLQSMVFSSGDAGFGVLTDILTGYFDKLLLSPINRFAILFATLFTSSLRAMIQVGIIILISLALGVTYQTGWQGILLVLWFATTFSVAWTCLGIIIAIRTKSAEVTQSYFVLFFPAVFLTSAFVPRDYLPGWFQIAVSINPVTYVLESMRAIVVAGWQTSDILPGFVVVVSLTAVMLLITTWVFHKSTA